MRAAILFLAFEGHGALAANWSPGGQSTPPLGSRKSSATGPTGSVWWNPRGVPVVEHLYRLTRADWQGVSSRSRSNLDACLGMFGVGLSGVPRPTGASEPVRQASPSNPASHRAVLSAIRDVARSRDSNPRPLLRRQTLYPLSYERGTSRERRAASLAEDFGRPAGSGLGNEVAPPKRATATVPLKSDEPVVETLLPRHKGIYHAGRTGYPNPTYR